MWSVEYRLDLDASNASAFKSLLGDLIERVGRSSAAPRLLLGMPSVTHEGDAIVCRWVELVASDAGDAFSQTGAILSQIMVLLPGCGECSVQATAWRGGD